jgi:hypothetical protein
MASPARHARSRAAVVGFEPSLRTRAAPVRGNGFPRPETSRGMPSVFSRR